MSTRKNAEPSPAKLRALANARATPPTAPNLREQGANARLIAAAPELLAALELSVKITRDGIDPANDGARLIHIRQIALTAIAKAKGD